MIASVRRGFTNGLHALVTAVTLMLLLISCAQRTTTPDEPTTEPVGAVTLNQAVNSPVPYQLLEVGIAVFDTDKLEPSKFGQWIFAEIRDKETRYLPYALRNTLLASNQWGAVRVLPQSDPSLDLLVSGTILKSDGVSLELNIRAVDSTGREWLDKTYADTANAEDYPESTRFNSWNRFDPDSFVDPFQDIYDQISNDLVAAREKLAAPKLVDLARVSRMKYAADLSQATFSHTLVKDTDGLLSVASLPAKGDPMLRRVEDMRSRHLVYIDTVDEYYQALYEEMQSTYVAWRRYSLDQIEETRAAAKKKYDADDYGKSDNFLTLSQRYDRYKWSKIYQHKFTELAASFNSELEPAVLELNRQVYILKGSMEDRYRQWREILRSIFALETGLEIPGDGIKEAAN